LGTNKQSSDDSGGTRVSKMISFIEQWLANNDVNKHARHLKCELKSFGLKRRIHTVAVVSFAYSAAVEGERAAMDRLPASVQVHIVQFAGHHDTWNILTVGGQNHPCARAWNEEDWYGGCFVCNDLWYLKTGSRQWKLAVLEHAKRCKAAAVILSG
jgi:hypothetical protein